MHKLIITSAIALALPALASANITSNTSASSQTGGNVVGPGGKVETGSASASVTTSNVKGSSTSSIYIKTDTGGQVHEESYTTNSSKVDVTVQATPKATTVDVREGSDAKVTEHRVVPVSAGVSREVIATTSTTSQPGADFNNEVEVSLGTTIVLAIQSFFAGILSWFK